MIQYFLAFGKYLKLGPRVMMLSGHNFFISNIDPASLASSANQHCLVTDAAVGHGKGIALRRTLDGNNFFASHDEEACRLPICVDGVGCHYWAKNPDVVECRCSIESIECVGGVDKKDSVGIIRFKNGALPVYSSFASGLLPCAQLK